MAAVIVFFFNTENNSIEVKLNMKEKMNKFLKGITNCQELLG
jgi:hypothetical protein